MPSAAHTGVVRPHPPSTRPVVLHVAPHPDDEALGVPATLLGLQGAGADVRCLLVSLGRPHQHLRRLAETRTAAARAGWRTEVLDPPLALSRGDDLPTARAVLADELHRRLLTLAPDVVVAPWPGDGHHGHETVALAVGDALGRLAVPPPWWAWGLWVDLPRPTLYVPFGESLLSRAQHVLAAYEGELARARYDLMLAGRAVTAAVLGGERVFGYGSGAASPQPYAELLTEALLVDGVWRGGRPRMLHTGAAGLAPDGVGAPLPGWPAAGP